MYLYDYFWFLGAIIVCMVFACFASSKVNKTFAKHNVASTRSRMTGYDTVVCLMRANDIKNISVGRIKGHLSDHYHPTKEIVNLSESTYGNSSVSAVAVAAHEIGHVMQKKEGYFLYKLRAFLVPAVNFGTRMAMPLVLIGLFVEYFISTSNPDVGFYIALVGVIFYGGALLFALVTLPVELNASKRAKQMLASEGILTKEEMTGANEVLSAAALTYLASLMTSLVYFLRFLVHVLTLFGRRDNRN